MTRGQARHRRSMVALGVLTVYALLLLASHLVQHSKRSRDDQRLPIERSIEIPMVTREGPSPNERLLLGYADIGLPAHADDAPIVLLHGSPGRALDFMLLQDESGQTFVDHLAKAGRRVIAIDLPGFGRSERWVPDYSFEASAYAVIELLDALGLDRVHLVCWSNSGGVGLHVSDLARDRVASLTLLASIGAQETEGSGSYWFEQGKYLLGVPVVVALPELIPHFGSLGTTEFRHTFIRSFLDSDQRPLENVMRRLQVPTLILHGRHDPLVPDWAAEYHHSLISTSRLVMLDASHFLPLLQPRQSAVFILEHAERHDPLGVPPLTLYEDLAPPTEVAGPIGWIEHAGVVVRWTAWWVLTPLLAVFAWRRPDTATLLAAFFVASGNLDFGVAFVGLFLGQIIDRVRGARQTRSARSVLSAVLWVPFALSLASIVAALIDGPAGAWDGWAFVPIFFVGVIGLRSLRLGLTWVGRRRIAATITRALHHEWWPSSVYYASILPNLAQEAWRSRSVLAFAAANPGIENGGGFVGESKSAIVAQFHPMETLVLPAVRIDDCDDRYTRALLALESTPALGGFPVVVKPDSGQKGIGVALVHDPIELEAAIHSIPGAIMLQRFHPGPHECSVFWMRKSAAEDPTPIDQRDGFIYSITRKVFQRLEGDGQSTVAQLIWSHPRYRCQASLFLDRFSNQLDRVLAPAETLALSFAGNHAQGTMFMDGEDLKSPALEAAINDIARNFHNAGFDYGRFDLRFESEDLLRAGQGFAIIEANGTTSESTNMYDPSRSFAWARRVMLGHWQRLYALGAERNRLGYRTLTLGELLRLLLVPSGGKR